MHTCHAAGCTVEVPPRLLMCRKHWYMVPKTTRAKVWSEYRPGQEVDKQPTAEYMQIQRSAVGQVAQLENRNPFNGHPLLNTEEVTLTAVATAVADDLEIFLDDDFAEEAERDNSFVGEIVIDQYEPDDKGGYKWHLAVKPLGFTIGGATGAFHCWPKVKAGEKPSPKSAVAQIIPTIKAVFGNKPDGSPYRIGKGDLLGLVAMFERRDHSFGINKKTGEEIVAKQLLFAVSPADGYSTDAPRNVELPLLTDEELDKVAALASGKTFREVKAAAVADKDLSQELRAKIIGRTALVFAVEQGRLVIDGENYVEVPF